MQNCNFIRTTVVGAITKNGVRKSQNGEFLNVSVSCRVRGGEQAEYEFIEFTAPLALEQYLTEGRFITVRGRPTARAYQTKAGEVKGSLELKNARIDLKGSKEMVLIGNIGRQESIRVIDGQRGKFIGFPFAVSEGSKESERTTWYEATVNVGEGKPLPESMIDAIKQGVPCVISGDVAADCYVPEGGEPQPKLKLFVRSIQVGRKNEDGGTDAGEAGQDDQPDFS